MKELTSSDYYLRVGNEPDSGSDSQPEKGSFPEKNCKTDVNTKEHSRKTEREPVRLHQLRIIIELLLKFHPM